MIVPCMLIAFLSSLQERAPEITFELPVAGRVSLAVYDPGGVQIRALLHSEPRPAGRHTVRWDGLDRTGKPVPAGPYVWKLVHGPGIKAEYLMSLGVSSGHRPWPGQHGGPTTLAVDTEGFVVGAPEEGAPLLTRADAQGKPLWHAAGGMGFGGPARFSAGETPYSLASDAGRLYSLMSSGQLYVLDLRTGTQITSPDGSPLVIPLVSTLRALGDVPLTSARDQENKPALSREFDVPNGTYLVRYKARLDAGCGTDAKLSVSTNGEWFSFTDLGLKPGARMEAIGPRVWGVTPHKLTVKDGKLKLSFFFQDKNPAGKWAIDAIELLDPATRIDARSGALVALFPGSGSVSWLDVDAGTPAPGTAMANTHARDVALLSTDEAVVAAHDRVLRIKRGGRAVVLAEGLSGVMRIATDPANRKIFVYCEEPKAQVVVLDAASGKVLNVFGRDGGRRTGLYRAEDFRGVSDVAADGRGGFYVTEDQSAPRRTARFDGKGALQQEWYGGQQYYCAASVDPARPDRVWMESHWGWMMELQVDWARKTWKPRATYRWGEALPERLIANDTLALMTRGMYVFYAKLGAAKEPEAYLWSTAHSGLIVKPDEAAGVLRPVAALGTVDIKGDGQERAPLEALPAAWKAAVDKAGLDVSDWEKRKLHNGFGWADADGDFSVDAEEIRPFAWKPAGGYTPDPFRGFGTCGYLDPRDFTLVTSWEGSFAKVPASGRTSAGVPIWDWATRTEGPKTPYQATKSVYRDSEGSVYQVAVGGGDGYSTGNVTSWDGHGPWWPGTQSNGTVFAKYAPDGRLLWRSGNHASRAAQAYRLHYPVKIAGVVEGCVGVVDKMHEPLQLWTTDGLYVGRFNDRRADDGLPDQAYYWDGDYYKGPVFNTDMASGGSLTSLAPGEALFLGSGVNSVPAFRLTGWTELKRLEGKVSVSAATPAAAAKGSGLTADYYAGAVLPPAGSPSAMRRTDSTIWFGGGKAWPDAAATKSDFTVRWSGMIEPKYSEEHSFAVYSRGGCRLWIGGKLVLDRWESREGKHFSNPLALTAGEKVSISLEWRHLGGAPEAHLCWESSTLQIEHVPAECLYPGTSEALPSVSIRTNLITAHRPGTGPATAPEITISRDGPADRPMRLGVAWLGSARPGIDYKALPDTVTLPAGRTMATLKLEPLPAVEAPLSTGRHLIAELKVGGAYGLSESNVVQISIIDGRAERLRVEDVEVSGARGNSHEALDLRKEDLRKLIDGTGIDRSVDPPAHSHRPEDHWLPENLSQQGATLIFDLGRSRHVSDALVWNFNVTSGHGQGWGQGQLVRNFVRDFKIAVSDQKDGPWTAVGDFRLRRASGRAPADPDRLALGVKSRYFKFTFSKNPDSDQDCFFLGAVEFHGEGGKP